MNSIKVAITFLTIIPAGHCSFSASTLSRSSPWFPLVGAVLGLLFWVLSYFAIPVMSAGPVIVIVFVVSFLLTRGLHVDGLSDTADGLAGGMDKERVFTIMRDGAAGPGGVTAILLVYMFKFAALSALEPVNIPFILYLMPVWSRWCMVSAGVWHKPARPDGLGNHFVRDLQWHHLAGATAVSVLLSLPLIIVFFPLLLPVLAGAVIALFLSLLMTAVIARRLGGISGDILGAVNEVAGAGFLAGPLLFL